MIAINMTFCARQKDPFMVLNKLPMHGTQVEHWFQEKGIKKCFLDVNLYVLCDGDNIVIVFHVDDFIDNDDDLIHQFKNVLSYVFNIEDLDNLHYYLGLEVWQDKNKLICFRPSMLWRF